MALWRSFPPPLSPSVLVGAWTEGPRRFAALGLLCLSCTTGQTGGQVVEHDPSFETLAACDIVRHVPVEPDDADLPFDLEALIETVEGSSSTQTLDWGALLPEGNSLTPDPGLHSIEIEIRYVEGSAERVELEVPEAGGAEPASAGASGDNSEVVCPPLLSFGAEITVITDSGAITDTFQATFIAHSAHLATAAFDLVPGEFEGDLTFDLEGESDELLDRARIDLACADGTLSGRISANEEASEIVTTLEIGRFPSGGCDEGHDLASSSDFAARAQAAVSAMTELELTWPDGALTELSLAHEYNQACMVPWGTTTGVVLPLASSVSTADGGIDGRWSLTASVTFDDAGEAQWVDVARADVGVIEPGEFVTSTGITGLDVDPEMPATFSFQLSDQLDDELPASGTLTVLESHPAVCDLPPEEPTDGGGVAPGCSGDELVEIGTASLTQAN